MQSKCLPVLLLLFSFLTVFCNSDAHAQHEDTQVPRELKQTLDDKDGPASKDEKEPSVDPEPEMDKKEKHLEITPLELKKQLELQQEQQLEMKKQLLEVSSDDPFPTEIIVASIGAVATVVAALIAVSKRK